MSTAHRPEPFRPPHDPASCAVCLYLDHVTRLAKHDPATCPGCMNAAMGDYDADPKQDAGGAAAWAVVSIGVGLLLGIVVVLWLAGY